MEGLPVHIATGGRAYAPIARRGYRISPSATFVDVRIEHTTVLLLAFIQYTCSCIVYIPNSGVFIRFNLPQAQRSASGAQRSAEPQGEGHGRYYALWRLLSVS